MPETFKESPPAPEVWHWYDVQGNHQLGLKAKDNFGADIHWSLESSAVLMQDRYDQFKLTWVDRHALTRYFGDNAWTAKDQERLEYLEDQFMGGFCTDASLDEQSKLLERKVRYVNAGGTLPVKGEQ